MVRIWRERIALLDTGALYRSTLAVGMTADGKVTSVTLSQRFNTYVIFQDYGTGREVPRGNPGDIGRDFCGIVANALNDRSFRASLIR